MGLVESMLWFFAISTFLGGTLLLAIVIISFYQAVKAKDKFL